jgi:hypothetical protein
MVLRERRGGKNIVLEQICPLPVRKNCVELRRGRSAHGRSLPVIQIDDAIVDMKLQAVGVS